MYDNSLSGAVSMCKIQIKEFLLSNEVRKANYCTFKGIYL